MHTPNKEGRDPIKDATPSTQDDYIVTTHSASLWGATLAESSAGFKRHGLYASPLEGRTLRRKMERKMAKMAKKGGYHG
jgi:hypothetical protein